MSRHHIKQHKSPCRSSLFAQNDESTGFGDINTHHGNDTITITPKTYTPSQAYMNLTGFDDISPFISKKSTHTLNSVHDNTFEDYNEEAPNDINNSSYRQQMIKRMQQSVFDTSNAMFSQSERITVNNQNGSTYDASGSYSPSKAPSRYLQQQTASLFKDVV